MAFHRDFKFANAELKGVVTSLSEKLSRLDGKHLQNIGVELTGLLKVLFYGASYENLDELVKLSIFNSLKKLSGLNGTYSQQNGVPFKEKLALALVLRIVCFDPEGEVIRIPELKGKQMYQIACNLFQRNLGRQVDTLKKIVLQGMTAHNVASGVPKKTILYLPVTTEHVDKWKVDQAAEISKVISQWFLLHCNQASSMPTGKKSGMFQKKNQPSAPRTTELDGTVARGIFTILNIMPSYHGDWLMNVYAFSVLKQWISFLQGSESITDCLTSIPMASFQTKRGSFSSYAESSISPSENRMHDSGSGSDSIDTQSIASSFMSANDSLFADDLYDDANSPSRSSSFAAETRSQLSFHRSPRSPDTLSVTSELSAASSNLKLVSIKYCLRILGQSEKVPQRISDRTVVSAAIVECLQILGKLCDNVTAISQRAFNEIKRLHNRIEAKPLTTRRVYVELLQFYISHHEAMIVQIDDTMECYFTEVPSNLYHNQFAAFELLNLCLKNQDFFKHTSSVLSTYFPNVFKIIAWWPCSFLDEFCELIEVFVNESNYLESFHTILDLPTMAAVLYLKHSKVLDDDDHLAKLLGTSIQPEFAAMFSFLLRTKSGSGETIDKLSELHNALQSLSKHSRIKYVSEIVPALLLSYFNVLEKISRGQCDYVCNLFPVILERCFQLFPKTDTANEILDIFAEYIQLIVKIAPNVVSLYLDDILSFFTHINVAPSGLASLLCSVIWCIGECVSTCKRGQVFLFYETLETMLYEASADGGFPSTNILSKPEVITSLVSALSKLAAHSEELIPRAVVSMNKICNLRREIFVPGLSLADKLAVTTYAQEMINLLQKPKVAPLILCNRQNVVPWHFGADSSLDSTIRVLAKYSDVNA